MRLEKSVDLDNVYKLFGVCAHHCSNIEYSVAFLLHPVKWKKHEAHLKHKNQETQNTRDIKKWTVAMKKFDEAIDNVSQDIDNLDKMTLGKLINQIKGNYPLLEVQARYLKEILDKRNYVIHKMWGAYGRRLKDPQVIREMLGELQDCESYFRSSSDWLRKQAYLLNGFSEEMIND
jgi:hypothetical protein